MRIVSKWLLTILVFFIAGCEVKFQDPRNLSPASSTNETTQASTAPTTVPPIPTSAPAAPTTVPLPPITSNSTPTNTYTLLENTYHTSVTTCNDTPVEIAFVPTMTNIVMDPNGWHGSFTLVNRNILFSPAAGYGGSAGVSYNGTVNGQARHVEASITVSFCTINPPPQASSSPAPGPTPTVTAVTITPQFIKTPAKLNIPNFCDGAVASGTTTVNAIANGNWSSASTWSTNQVPAAGQRVIIAGKSVIYDVASSPEIKTLCIDNGGVLKFSTTMSTQLVVQNLLDLPGGTLEIGSAANPLPSNFKAELIFADQPLDTVLDPEQYGNGLIAFGKVNIHGSVLSDTFVRLDVEPQAGDTTLTLSKPVSGWKNGDKLVLPDSRQLPWNGQGNNYVSQVERPTLTSVSSNGLILTLSAPLLYAHAGIHTTASNSSPIESFKGIKFLAHVGNLSRNVLIRSKSATQAARGYAMFTERAEVDIRYAQFSGTGRTKNPSAAWPDNTTFNSNGNVNHIGLNQEGRYPIYFIHLYGPANVTSAPQYTFLGNSVFCPLNPMPFKWGITISDSHFGLIKDNVLFNWAGAGMMTENGNENRNVIEHNFVVHSPGTGAREDIYSIRWGMAGHGYFFRGPLNYFRDNVASGAPSGVYSYGFAFNFDSVGAQRVPIAAGKSTNLPGDYIVPNLNAQAVVEFARNETYGAISSGMTYWWWNTTFHTPHNNGGSFIDDLRVWNHYTYGVFPYQSNKVTLDGLVIRGDLAMAVNGSGKWGIIPVDYYGKDITVINADIRNMAGGLGFSGVSEGTLTVQDSYFQNFVDIDARNSQLSGIFAPSIQPRKIILRNNKFVAIPGKSHIAIARTFYEFDMTNNISLDQLFSYDHNQIPGNDLQIYYADQAANHFIPPNWYNPSNPSVIWALGCPLPPPDPANCLFRGVKTGCHTNQQCFDATGVTTSGELRPNSSYYTDPEIIGDIVDR